ncbi:hypothetical protein ACRALDRAFT_2015696 [Sodiomyces alcalophilus JCM 7366]|uniref:uncharacterized protein n=1 Tax=Sodiomyces alcalophilus JCM 7366 TaxID=591952 RepID=UPI0039B545F6
MLDRMTPCHDLIQYNVQVHEEGEGRGGINNAAQYLKVSSLQGTRRCSLSYLPSVLLDGCHETARHNIANTSILSHPSPLQLSHSTCVLRKADLSCVSWCSWGIRDDALATFRVVSPEKRVWYNYRTRHLSNTWSFRFTKHLTHLGLSPPKECRLWQVCLPCPCRSSDPSPFSQSMIGLYLSLATTSPSIRCMLSKYNKALHRRSRQEGIFNVLRSNFNAPSYPRTMKWPLFELQIPGYHLCASSSFSLLPTLFQSPPSSFVPFLSVRSFSSRRSLFSFLSFALASPPGYISSVIVNTAIGPQNHTIRHKGRLGYFSLLTPSRTNLPKEKGGQTRDNTNKASRQHDAIPSINLESQRREEGQIGKNTTTLGFATTRLKDELTNRFARLSLMSYTLSSFFGLVLLQYIVLQTRHATPRSSTSDSNPPTTAFLVWAPRLSASVAEHEHHSRSVIPTVVRFLANRFPRPTSSIMTTPPRGPSLAQARHLTNHRSTSSDDSSNNNNDNNSHGSDDNTKSERHSHWYFHRNRLAPSRASSNPPQLQNRQEPVPDVVHAHDVEGTFVTHIVQTVSVVQVVDSVGSAIELQTHYAPPATVVVDPVSGLTETLDSNIASAAPTPASRQPESDLAPEIHPIPTPDSLPGLDLVPDSSSLSVAVPSAIPVPLEDHVSSQDVIPPHGPSSSSASPTFPVMGGVSNSTRPHLLPSSLYHNSSIPLKAATAFASSSSSSFIPSSSFLSTTSSSSGSTRTITTTTRFTTTSSTGQAGGSTEQEAGVEEAPGLEPTPFSPSSHSEDTDDTVPATGVVVGSVVGSIAGAAVLFFLVLFALRMRKRKHGRIMLGEGAGAGPGNGSRGLLPGTDGPSGDGGMTQRSVGLGAALAGLSPKRTSRNGTVPPSTEAERGFYRVSGRKLPPVILNGGDGYTAPRDSTMSGGESVYYRESRPFFHDGSRAADPPARLAVGAPMRPVSGVPVMRTGPARVAVTEENPFADPFSDNMGPLEAPPRDPTARSLVSREGTSIDLFIQLAGEDNWSREGENPLDVYDCIWWLAFFLPANRTHAMYNEKGPSSYLASIRSWPVFQEQKRRLIHHGYADPVEDDVFAKL